MALPRDLPVVDHHCHLSPSGEGIAAARRFRDSGGTHLFLATQNYREEPPRSLATYAEQYATTEELAHRVTEETGVVVYPIVAPYPIDLVHVARDLGLEGAVQLQFDALDLAGRWVREHRAVALGEVGLPHFEVPAEVRDATDRVFDRALGIARESDCPAVVHCADLDRAGYADLAARADRAGLPRRRVVKHYARNRLPAAERSDVTPSYLARRELVREVLADAGPWFLETDFLDDPKRPGAVLDLATVPRRAQALATTPEGAECLRVPFVRSVEQVYGLRLEVLPGGRP